MNLLDTNQLRGNEFFVLLSWHDTYRSDCFMGDPRLGINVDELEPLLDDKYYRRVLNSYLEVADKEISFLFQNAMEKNYRDWHQNVTPYSIEGFSESTLPNDINTMLIQKVYLSKYKKHLI